MLTVLLEFVGETHLLSRHGPKMEGYCSKSGVHVIGCCSSIMHANQEVLSTVQVWYQGCINLAFRLQNYWYELNIELRLRLHYIPYTWGAKYVRLNSLVVCCSQQACSPSGKLVPWPTLRSVRCPTKKYEPERQRNDATACQEQASCSPSLPGDICGMYFEVDRPR